MTEYWIDVHGCQRVITELRGIVDASNDFQWVNDDLMMVDRHTYAAEESANTQSDAEKVDQAYYSFLEEKLEPTYDRVMRELTNCINAMEEAVNYYVSGDAAMAYEASGATSDFPEYRSGDGTSTSGIPSPSDSPDQSGGSSPEPSPMPSYPDPNDPLGGEQYISNPYEAAYGSQG